jgi:transcriptional regulator with XRE-family HTH domain
VVTTTPPETADEDPLLSAVGRRVQQLREARGLKAADFARAAGVTQQYLWRVEQGQQNLNLRSISRLAIALDLQMTALLEGIEPDPSTVRKRAYRRTGADT